MGQVMSAMSGDECRVSMGHEVMYRVLLRPAWIGSRR